MVELSRKSMIARDDKLRVPLQLPSSVEKQAPDSEYANRDAKAVPPQTGRTRLKKLSSTLILKSPSS